MIKFYYSGAPNPMKVALFLEEAGLVGEDVVRVLVVALLARGALQGLFQAHLLLDQFGDGAFAGAGSSAEGDDHAGA